MAYHGSMHGERTRHLVCLRIARLQASGRTRLCVLESDLARRPPSALVRLVPAPMDRSQFVPILTSIDPRQRCSLRATQCAEGTASAVLQRIPHRTAVGGVNQCGGDYSWSSRGLGAIPDSAQSTNCWSGTRPSPACTTNIMPCARSAGGNRHAS